MPSSALIPRLTQLSPVGQSPSLQRRVQYALVALAPRQRPVAQSLPCEHGSPSHALPVARAQVSSTTPPLGSGPQPKPVGQPPAKVHRCPHEAGVVPSSHAPLRQLFVAAVASQEAPSGEAPSTSAGGTQTCCPSFTAHVYAESPEMSRRFGQSAAVWHFAVQPTPAPPQKPRPLGHSSALPHGISMFTQIFLPETSEHAKPAAQSLALLHSCVHCADVALPEQYCAHGTAVVGLHGVPLSSSTHVWAESQIWP